VSQLYFSCVCIKLVYLQDLTPKYAQNKQKPGIICKTIFKLVLHFFKILVLNFFFDLSLIGYHILLCCIKQCLGSGSARFWLPGSVSAKICGSTDPDPREKILTKNFKKQTFILSNPNLIYLKKIFKNFLISECFINLA